MLGLILAVSDVTSGTSEESGTNEELTWTITEENTVLTIAGTGEMGSSQWKQWYDYHKDIQKVVIEDGVTSIGTYAFNECYNLTSVSIPDSVKSIEKCAFFHCSSLTSVSIPNGVTSIGNSAFSGCTNLTSVTLPDSVTSIGGGAFSKCINLTSVTLPDSLTTIYYEAFENCSSLIKVTIPDHVNIKERSYADGSMLFKGCSSLTSVNLPSTVTRIDKYVFKGCSSLESIIIPNSVTFINSEAFNECKISKIYGEFGSYAHEYALKNDITFIGSWNDTGKPQTGFIKEKDIWFYFDDNHLLHEGWLELDGKWYYCDPYAANFTFNKTTINLSAIRTGFGFVPNDTGTTDYYFFDETDGHMITGFVEYQDHLFYFDDNGKIHSGWLAIDNKKYYCDPVIRMDYNGSVYENIPAVRNTGLTIINEGESTHTYFFDENGVMKTGIVKNYDVYYCFDDDGRMQTDCLKKSSEGELYYFTADGSSAKGWVNIGEDTYYFNPEALTNGKYYLEKDNIYQYYTFDENGRVIPEAAEPSNNDEDLDVLSKLASLTQDNADTLFYFTYGYYPLRNQLIVSKTTVCINSSIKVGYIIKGGEKQYSYKAYWEEKTDEDWKTVEEFEVSNPSKGLACITQDHATELRLRLVPIGSDDTLLILQSDIISVINHTEILDEAIVATCTEDGLTEGKHCSTCGEVFVAQEAIPALGHTEVMDEAVAATCTETGLTEGKHCSTCGEVLVAQEVVPALGHTLLTHNIVDSTTTEAGHEAYWECTACGKLFSDEGITEIEKPGEIPAIPDAKIGWLYQNEKWYYIDNDGEYVTGWLRSGEEWYLMNPDGIMVTGWGQDNGKWYFFSASGAMRTGWLLSGGAWYLLKPNGEMAIDWAQDNGNWYFFNQSGEMKTGWQQIDGVWYYFNTSGAMVTGWQQIGGIWYYFKSSGAMATGWTQIRGIWYYFNASGAMQTSWQQIGGNWYFFMDSGAMATGWYEDKDIYGNSTWYWFDENGKMATGWKEIKGQWEMFADSGAWLYTWDGN